MRENKIHKIEVHVAGICIKDEKVLIVKRATTRTLYPGYWECGGGQVKVGENFSEAIKRQMKEELGVIVKPIYPISTYEIINSHLEQKKIPGIKFVCEILKYINNKEPQISREHTHFKWQRIDKLYEVNLIHGLDIDILKAYNFIQKYKKKYF